MPNNTRHCNNNRCTAGTRPAWQRWTSRGIWLRILIRQASPSLSRSCAVISRSFARYRCMATKIDKYTCPCSLETTNSWTRRRYCDNLRQYVHVAFLPHGWRGRAACGARFSLRAHVGPHARRRAVTNVTSPNGVTMVSRRRG